MCVSYFFRFIVAVYRYYESRRRIINDSSDHRKEQVSLNKENKASSESKTGKLCVYGCF